MIKLAIFGANGRMGRELVDLAQNDENINLIYSFTKKNNDYNKLLEADIIIDFSAPNASYELLNKVLNSSKTLGLVVGTTGLDENYFNLAKKYTGIFFHSTNTSLGVAILNELTQIATKALKDFDIEVYEKHHRYKIDAPSGTALTLASNIKKIKDENSKEKSSIIFNRNTKRKENEIGLTSIRGGSIAGYHNVGFYGEDESLELIHNANSRIIFAKGAIKIAKWIYHKSNGFYTMQDFIKELLD